VLSSIEQSDCLIKTSLSTLKELKETQQLTQLIKQDKLEIEGDIKVAQQFMQFAQSLHIDWLTELANHIGEVPTYKLSALAKKSLSQLNFTKTQIQADASEYIVHEQRLVVTNSELKRLYMQVSEVEKNIAQLEQRMHNILEKLAVK
jgi:ubiquinone biosynthesis protein UbiJ